MPIRPVRCLAKSKPTLEGAGVHLCSAFGFGDTAGRVLTTHVMNTQQELQQAFDDRETGKFLKPSPK
jgi:hypothetical protein